jgi:hypothetical protein
MKNKVYKPKKGVAAEFSFLPSNSVKKLYPDAETEMLQMDLQEDEVISVIASNILQSNESCVIEINGGSITLMEFSDNWEEISGLPEDAIVWDAERMISTWSFDD